ncbi:MAG: DNA polymerase I [Candidatus Hydrogenedentes bacterium]|nr:DNA polymerase I [Candidatus Hydrogenedentota bacterium]
MPDRLFLIDGSAFAYRAYFAIRGLTNSKGQPTNAVYGFARVLLKLLREHEPSHIAVIFDAPGKTFRDDLYAEYKATREATPDDLRSQFPLMHELVHAFNVRLIVHPGVEADDVMGTLAHQAAARGMEAVLVTGDKDMLQLVSEHVRVYDPGKGDQGQWITDADVRERFGVGPANVIDAMGLIGDSSDNVPGVRGIGPKTAKSLLEKYQSLENLYAHIDELSGKQRERLIESKELAFLSRTLCTIHTSLELPCTVDDCLRVEFDRAKMADVFAKLEFQSLLEEHTPNAAEVEVNDYQLVLTAEKLNAVIAEMRGNGAMAVDTETTSTDPMRAELVGVSMSCRPNTGYYIPVGHTAMAMSVMGIEGSSDILTRAEALDLMRPLLEDPAVAKIGHNIKYDLIVLERAGISLQGISLDTMVASYLTDPSRMRHNLDEVSLHYLSRKLIPISEMIGKGSKAVTFDTVPVDSACIYASEDADVTWRLAELFQPLLRERGLTALYDDVELPLIRVLARMEQAGVAIDERVFKGLQSEVEERLRVLEKDIHETAGELFQINSPKQLQEVLFGKLKLKPVRKTKTGYSTDVDVLEELADAHPLPRKVLEYRGLEKLRGTYIEALPKLVHPETGRIHTSFNQAVAATGRLSSSDPNLQNIPVRTEIGRRIREGFVPGKAGDKLISADYSQIELRILAHLSGDDHLREAFMNDADIHEETAARVFGVMPGFVTPEMRRHAKAVNFGVVYGISAFGLSRALGIPPSEAAKFIENYFQKYQGVRRWIDQTLTQAAKDGYVTTLLNRRRYVSDLTTSNQTVRKAAERVAMNTPVQGSAADIIKLAMVRLDEALRGTGAWLILQVHDELVVETPADKAEQTAVVMRTIMEEAFALSVPMKVDVAIGNHWAEIH